MIQRLQSLYLSIVTILTLFFLKIRILVFTGTERENFIIRFKGLVQTFPDKDSILIKHTFLLSLLIILIPVVSVIAIFLFRNRKLQLKITAGALFLSLLFILAEIIYSIAFIKGSQISLVPDLTMLFPFINAILLFLAFRGIKKDEELVRSYDRLR